MYWTRHDAKELRHDPSWHEVVCPDAAVDEFARDVEILGLVKNLCANSDHASGEAAKVLDLRVEGDAKPGYRSGVACKKNIAIVDCHGTKEDVLLDGDQGRLIESLILEFKTSKEQILLFRVSEAYMD
jgi:hypothetical protein